PDLAAGCRLVVHEVDAAGPGGQLAGRVARGQAGDALDRGPVAAPDLVAVHAVVGDEPDRAVPGDQLLEAARTVGTGDDFERGRLGDARVDDEQLDAGGTGLAEEEEAGAERRQLLRVETRL